MLRRKYKLKKEKDFQKVFNEGKSYYSNFIGLKLINNKLDFNRFAIIISRKVSKKAVERNKIKRRIEEIIRLNFFNFKKSFDVIIITKKDILSLSYSEIEGNLMDLFKKAGFLKSKKDLK